MKRADAGEGGLGEGSGDNSGHNSSTATKAFLRESATRTLAHGISTQREL